MMLQMQSIELTLLTTDVRYADKRLEHSDQGLPNRKIDTQGPAKILKKRSGDP